MTSTRRKTSLSYSLAWALARSNAWDPEPTHHTGLLGSYLPIMTYGNDTSDSNVVGHYLSYAANDKVTSDFELWDYELWENVISGVEYSSPDTELDGAELGDWPGVYPRWWD